MPRVRSQKEREKQYLRNKAYYASHKEESKLATREWYAKNGDRKDVRVRQLMRSIKARAKKLGIPFCLNVSDLVWPLKCPILGIELDYGRKVKKRMQPNSPSVDRMDPEKGYVVDNVWVISMRANAIKQNATAAEIAAVAKWMSVFS